ncbi:AGAP003284-PA-like protein [Anopheles sinensis]|uniref:AGAP003284-PA-like protein n=1 Tax=Anopheles sinensis TaxID=74873 RepID=A0A084VBJ3_ANOSI|nr:AGAP003284-PA-like protein [Anopheles sinensis]
MKINVFYNSSTSQVDSIYGECLNFKWNRVVYFYERQSYYNVAGPQTGHLLMNTMAEFFRHENITYSPFSTDSARTNLTESLKEKVGLSYASYGIHKGVKR